MNYRERLKRVIDFIGQHLDEDISLTCLSGIFCVSKFHFHRLFTALTGLSLHQYIRWLRLKRAAHQLALDKDRSIINIAIQAGFESHEAFSRVFKKACGFTPSQFRQNPHWIYWEKSPYCLTNSEELNMKVEIKDLHKIRLAMIEHRGDPKLISESINKLISWTKMQSIPLKLKAGEAFSIAYDDPKKTPAAEFRLDLGIKIPENLILDNTVIEKYLPAGRYAIAMHHGSRHRIDETVYALYREWLPNSEEQLGELPCVFCYHNFEHEIAETALLTECRLLLK